MKKVLSFTLALLMLLSLFGCAPGNPTPDPTDPPATQPPATTTEPTHTTTPTNPTYTTNPTEPTVPTIPTIPTEPTVPTDDPVIPEVPKDISISSGTSTITDPFTCVTKASYYDEKNCVWIPYQGSPGSHTLLFHDWTQGDAFLPEIALEGNLQLDLGENGTLTRVLAYNVTDGEANLQLQDSSLEALTQLAPGRWYVILSVSWQGRYVDVELQHEYQECDHLFTLVIPEPEVPPFVWSFDEVTGTLTFSDCARMDDYSRYSSELPPWEDIREQVRHIVIGEGVKRIGNYAFYDMPLLVSVSLPEGLEEIGEYAFCDAVSLPEITFPDSLRLIDKSAFNRCGALQHITLPTSIETVAHWSFAECHGLQEVTILGSPSVVNKAFSDCENMQIIRFCGDLPAEHYYSLHPTEAICYYPLDNDTWTEEFFSDQGYTMFYVATENPALAALPSDPYAGPCGRTVRWKLENGVLTISGTGDWHHSPWWQHRDEIKKVIIEDGITNIAGSGFYSCVNLKEISIPESVTSIGSSAFSGCSALKTITLPAGLTVLGSSAFYACTALTKIWIPECITSIAGYTFQGCTSLKQVKLPSALTQIENAAFLGCTALPEITFPATLTALGDGAFNGCTALKKLYFYGEPPTVKNATFKNVTATAYYPPGNESWEYGGMGYHGGNISEKPDPNRPNNLCENHSYGEWIVTKEPTVTQLGERERICTVCGHKQKETMGPIVPDYTQPTHPELGEPVASGKWDGGNALWTLYADGTLSVFGKRFMQGASNGNFPWKAYAEQVTRIIVEEGLTSIADNAFNEMPNLTTVELHSTLQTIGNEAFANCPKLTSITIPASVTEIGTYVFWNCRALKSITFEEGIGITSIPTGMFMNTGLTAIQIPAGITEIADSAFSGCSALASVTLPEGLEKIQRKAFCDCAKISSLTVPGSLTTIQSDSFKGCTGITHLELYVNVDYYYDFRDCPIESIVFHGTLSTVSGFSGCETLTSVTLPDTIHTIESDAFFGCPLTQIIWPASLTTIESGAFAGALFTEIVLPDSVCHVGSGAFSSCRNLLSFTCGSGLTNLESCTLAHCASLKTVNLGNVKSIGFEVFANCSSLETVIWSENIESMGYYAFQNCTSLTSITIPASVKTLDHSIFAGCTALKEVFFLGDAPKMEAYIFLWLNLTAYYPADNPTWTPAKLQDYGGTITWVPVEMAP